MKSKGRIAERADALVTDSEILRVLLTEGDYVDIEARGGLLRIDSAYDITSKQKERAMAIVLEANGR